MSNKPPEHLHEVEVVAGDIRVMAHTESNPVTVSVWDGDEQVHEEVAALQKDQLIWWADGYAKAEFRYNND
jgi:hypothetical protein